MSILWNTLIYNENGPISEFTMKNFFSGIDSFLIVIYLLDCSVVLVVFSVVVVVLMSISQLLPPKPSLQKHFVCLNLSAKHVPSFWHVVSVQGLFTTSFYFSWILLFFIISIYFTEVFLITFTVFSGKSNCTKTIVLIRPIFFTLPSILALIFITCLQIWGTKMAFVLKKNIFEK